MFYVIGKVFTAFLHPIMWLIIYLLYSTHWHKPLKSKWTYILFILAFLSSNKVFVNQIGLILENQYCIPKSNLPKTAVVLGGYCDFDSDRQNITFYPAADRLFKAAWLYKTKLVSTIILSGGSASANKRPESEIAFSYLQSIGIATKDVICETKSINTFQNALFSKSYFNAGDSITLITSAFHMPRAVAVFKNQGFIPIAYPTNFTTCGTTSFVFTDYFVPSTLALLNFDMYIKEFMGIFAYKLSGKL